MREINKIISKELSERAGANRTEICFNFLKERNCKKY